MPKTKDGYLIDDSYQGAYFTDDEPIIEDEEKEKAKGNELASGDDANVTQLDVERDGDLLGGTDENHIP